MSGTGKVEYACKVPVPSVPSVDPATGMMSREWFNWSLKIMARTGGLQGVGSSDVQTTADAALANAATAQATANAAQATANTGVANAATAQATANINTAAIADETALRISVDSILLADITTETANRIAADALLAPKLNPSFTGTALFAGGIGVWGHAAPGAQPATPLLLSDVVTILQQYGLCA